MEKDSGFDLNKITGNEPPTGTTCPVCDEYVDELEACSDCYNSVWSERNLFQTKVSTKAIDTLIEQKWVIFRARKLNFETDLEYVAFMQTGNLGPEGIGRTKAEALADLLAKILLEMERR